MEAIPLFEPNVDKLDRRMICERSVKSVGFDTGSAILGGVSPAYSLMTNLPTGRKKSQASCGSCNARKNGTITIILSETKHAEKIHRSMNMSFSFQVGSEDLVFYLVE